MSLINSISDLMLGLGDVKAEEARQVIAQQELERQNKHRILKGTLRVLGAVAPLFIPGIGPLGGIWTEAGRDTLAAGLGSGLGMPGGGGLYNNMGIPQWGGAPNRQDPEYLDPYQYPDILRRRG